MPAKHEVKHELILDVVVREGTSIFQYNAIEDETLLGWGNAFLVLDLGLDILNGVRRLDIECIDLASASFHIDLLSW